MESLSTNILETCIVLYAHFSYSGIPAGDGGGRYEPELLITVAPPVCCRIYRLISYADLCLQPSKSSVSAPVTDISLYLPPPSPRSPLPTLRKCACLKADIFQIWRLRLRNLWAWGATLLPESSLSGSWKDCLMTIIGLFVHLNVQ